MLKPKGHVRTRGGAGGGGGVGTGRRGRPLACPPDFCHLLRHTRLQHPVLARSRAAEVTPEKRHGASFAVAWAQRCAAAWAPRSAAAWAQRCAAAWAPQSAAAWAQRWAAAWALRSAAVWAQRCAAVWAPRSAAARPRPAAADQATAAQRALGHRTSVSLGKGAVVTAWRRSGKGGGGGGGGGGSSVELSSFTVPVTRSYC